MWQQILSDPEYKPPPSWDKDGNPTAWWLSPAVQDGRTSVCGSKPLTVLMIVVGLVLLIACANVANLLLARAAAAGDWDPPGTGRGRARLVRQLVIETGGVLLGGVTGLAFAWWGCRYCSGCCPNARLRSISI